MKPKFKKGQVVRIATESYRTKWKEQQYQKIVRVWNWATCKASPFGYTLANGDNANEKYLRALTEGERG